MSANVRFLGTVTNLEVRSLMRKAQALILPSKWEAMPMVILEALSVGAPIIASDIPAHQFALKANAAIGFRCGDVQSLCAAITSLESDDELRAKTIEAGKVLRQLQSESAIAEQWRALLNSMTNEMGR